MGIEQSVEFGPVGCPPWSAVADCLTQSHFPVQIRMIDGELAFPDETPPETWQELRIGTPSGMITVRRSAAGVALVTWGNADTSLRQAWNVLTWAIAHCSQGLVVTGDARLSAEAYRRSASMPAELSPP